MAIEPIFIFSVPRSGSTLIQRIIAAHDGVATVSEPWLVLPHAYTFRPRGVSAEYQHPLMVGAIEDFCAELPHGGEDYRRALRECILGLYELAAGADARYFVDKSPPYCLVAAEIMSMFPEGKFVFLWRNPLSVVASIIETWEPWRPAMFRDDLFIGLPRLVAAFQGGRDRSHAVRFEDLVSGDEVGWGRLMHYLGIPFQPETLSRFSEVKLNGRMGDPTGAQRYSALSTEPQQKWKRTLANPLRTAWCRRYLNYLGAERLAVMGYDLAQLLREVDSQPSSTRALLPDLGRMMDDVLRELARVRTRNRKLGGPNVIRELIGA
jgi:Sulfotransferase family